MASFDRTAVETRLDTDPYAQRLGVKLVDVTPTEVIVTLVVSADQVNFLGLGHGGLVFSLADSAMAIASNAGAERAVAIDTHLVLSGSTRPGDRLQARVREMSRGKTLGTYRAEVTRGDGKTVGLFTGTVHITPG